MTQGAAYPSKPLSPWIYFRKQENISISSINTETAHVTSCLKTFLVKDKDSFVSHGEDHSSCWSGGAKGQGICSHDIDLVLFLEKIIILHVYVTYIFFDNKIMWTPLVCPKTMVACLQTHIDGLMQERRNSVANALELRLSCTNPSIWAKHKCDISLFSDIDLLRPYLSLWFTQEGCNSNALALESRLPCNNPSISCMFCPFYATKRVRARVTMTGKRHGCLGRWNVHQTTWDLWEYADLSPHVGIDCLSK